MFSNVKAPNGTTRQYPQWNARGKIRKIDEEGNVVPREYSFGGEVCRISPRFQKSGSNYRVRPERAAAFFAAFCYENQLLPAALTPEESATDWGLEILEPLWEEKQVPVQRLGEPLRCVRRHRALSPRGLLVHDPASCRGAHGRGPN